jgi:hypothetical protein
VTSLLPTRLGALSERPTRLAWLGHWLAGGELGETCAQLEALLVAAQQRDASATVGLVSFVQWVSGAVDVPRLHLLAKHALSTQCPGLGLMLRHAQECPLEFRTDAEPPKQCKERPLTLGERKNLARRSGRKGIARLLRDPHPAVLGELLLNPLLTEPDLVRLVSLRPASVGGICALARDGRWLLAPHVRLGILHNPGLPVWQTLPLLWLCSGPERAQIAASHNLPLVLRVTASKA